MYVMAKKKTIGDLLSDATLFARKHGKRQTPKQSFAKDKWFAVLTDELKVTYDGHPDSCDDGDTESYVVAIKVDGNWLTFFVDLDGCATDDPVADVKYTNERFQEDLSDQAESAGLSPSTAKKKIAAILEQANFAV
jgi:hypothetical protein